MRLLTHNMLQCPRTKAYPLELSVSECDNVSVEYSAPFLRRMFDRLDWPVFYSAVQKLPDADVVAKVPTEIPGANAEEDVLRAVHAALLEWHVVEGRLAAPGPDGPVYSISGGIPNLVITEVVVGKEHGESLGDGEMDGGEEEDGADDDRMER